MLARQLILHKVLEYQTFQIHYFLYEYQNENIFFARLNPEFLDRWK